MVFCKFSFIKDNSVALVEGSVCVRFFFLATVFLSPTFVKKITVPNRQKFENFSSALLDGSEEEGSGS